LDIILNIFQETEKKKAEVALVYDTDLRHWFSHLQVRPKVR